MTGRELAVHRRGARRRATSRATAPSPPAATTLLEAITGAARGAADDLVHARPRDGGAAGRRRPGRRGDLPGVHLRVVGQRVRAARRRAACSSTSGPTRSTSTSGWSKRRSRRAPGRSWSCTTPASAARWTCWPTSPAAHGLPVIEDNAHGLFGRYRGRPLGSVGATSTLSFHETKNLTCGEGGALVINDPALDRAGRGPAREGHQPQPVLPRPGRQVHLGRRRLELPAVGDPGRLPVGAARGARRDPGAAPRDLAALRRGAGRLGGADGRRHADRAAALRAPGAPVLPAAAVARRRDRG